MDDSPEVHTLITQKGYVNVFKDLERAEAYVGGKLVLSKMLLIEKNKIDTTTNEFINHARAVLDLASSGVSEATQLRYRSELPKATDAVASALDLMNDCKEGEDVEMIVADVQCAFCSCQIRVKSVGSWRQWLISS